MYALWRYFCPEPIGPTLEIDFGRWATEIDKLDQDYNNLATRMIQFIKEAGPDPYNRTACVEQLVDFAISEEITEKTVEYIYRHYVYQILSEHEQINVEQEEFDHLLNDFLLL